MKQEKTCKVRLIKILEILRQDSDGDNYLDSTEIIRKLNNMGIECQMRTLFDDIQVLNDYGYEILCEKEAGKPNRYCIEDRSFDVSELRILLDAVQASSCITEAKTEQLIDKIADLGGSHRKELLKSNIVRFNTTKSTNESIFYIIYEINNAIENKQKISFNYFDYNEKHERKLRRDGERYIVSPIATIFSDDNYYLVCFDGRHEGVAHYRIDRMENVRTEIEPIDKNIKIDVRKHKQEVFGMFKGEEVEVKFKANQTLLDHLFDKFGDKVKFNRINDEELVFSAKVQISPMFFGWCCSFGNKLQVLEPIEIREQLIDSINNLSKIYKEEK